jgi:hypothetical protein
MDNILVTVDGNNISRQSTKLDTSKINEFLEVVKQAYKKKPSQKDLDELRKWINNYPELWKVVFDTAHVIEENFIKNMVGNKVSIIAMQKNVDEIRNEMDYSKVSITEKMLIDNIVISWLGVQYCNYQLTTRMGREEKIVILEFWERRLSMSQRRYLHACETLEKVRRLMSRKPAVQVNIAAEGGQQVNVAGDILKK